MNCEAVDGCLIAAEPLWVNCDPPEGLPNINFFGAGAGFDLLNKPLVLVNRFEGAEPIRLKSDGPLGLTGVSEFTGRIGLPFNCGTMVVPLELEAARLLTLDDPSALESEADDPAPCPFAESASSLELFFDANGFKLLNHPACAGAA